MKRRILYLAIVAGFALQGCESVKVTDLSTLPYCIAEGSNPGNNTDSDCKIDVTIGQPKPGSCNISAVPDKVAFSERGKEKWIYWHILGTNDYVFPVYGINVNDNPGDFGKCKRSEGNKWCGISNKHMNDDKKYKYTIVVSGIGCPTDPWIYNR